MTPAQALVICDVINYARARPGEWFHDTDVFPARNNRDNASRRVLNRLRDDGTLSGFGLEVEQDCKPYVPRIRWPAMEGSAVPVAVREDDGCPF